jgi:hypothetical protein
VQRIVEMENQYKQEVKKEKSHEDCNITSIVQNNIQCEWNEIIILWSFSFLNSIIAPIILDLLSEIVHLK